MKKILLGLVCAAALMGAGLMSATWAADIKVINADVWFPEGPIWYQGKLYYVEYGRNTIMTWDGTKNDTFWKQDGCGPSAVVTNAAGQFLTTCYDSGTIGRISADGKTLTPYSKDSNGHGFVGPNDLAPDKKGGVYFTGSGHEGPAIDASVYYINKDGTTVTQVADDLHNANGLAVSNDGKTLYVIETEENRLLQFAINEDGTLTDRKVFLNLTDLFPKDPKIWPDGVKIDAKGELYIGQSPRSLDAPGKIIVVDGAGKLLRTIAVPSVSMPNLAFGPDEKVIYVMALDQIDKAPWHGKVYEVPNQ